MKPLSCPMPSNINGLQSNGFLFTIDKLPELSYFCQEVNIPELSLPAVDTDSPLSRVPYAGDKITFGDLVVTFMIDEEMVNYKAIHDWLIGLGFPELHAQYQRFINKNINGLRTTPVLASNSDGILSILNSSNIPVRTVHFVDMIPTSLQSLLLQSTTDNTVYLAGVATFAYNYYQFM